MRLGQDVLTNLDAATGRALDAALDTEWLLTNALGGAASGTAAGAHTRRSHAWLLAVDPAGRPAIPLLKLEERLRASGESFDLGCNLIGPAQARPAGHRLLESFASDPWPTWRWRAGGITLERSLFLLHTHHAVAVTYRHIEGPPARLSVAPLMVARSPRALQRVDESWRGLTQAVPGRVCVETSADGAALWLWHNGAFLPARVWQRGLLHPAEEAAAGSDAEAGDAAFVPGYLECELAAGGAFHVVASIERDLFRALAVEGLLGAPPPGSLGECVALLERGERDRLARWQRAAGTGAEVTARQAAAAHRAREAAAGDAAAAGGASPPAAEAPGAPAAAPDAARITAQDPWSSRLSRALYDGMVERNGRLTLLASLPAGAERGNEVLRTLPALITLRMFEPAREVLRGYVEYLNEGLAPESFAPGTHRPCYGNPEVSLWLIHAAELLIRRSEDLDLLREHILPAVEGIVQAYRSGTRHGVHVAGDGLLWSGEGKAASAQSGHNVLWFHALVATAQLARLAGRKEKSAFYLAWAREHQAQVLEKLWDEPNGCLLEARTESALRSGLAAAQILAVSLAPPLLPPERAMRLVTAIQRDLLTPLGLRTEPGAVSVSPAWLGPFISGFLRVHQRSAEAQAHAHGWLETLRAWLDERSAVHVPERIAAPRRGDGAARAGAPEAPPAQASVLAAAELLRTWIEDLDRSEAAAGVT
jgi:glycogen debranching enzyme